MDKRDVKDILFDFNEALTINDVVTMMECIVEMKKTAPVYVSLMLNSIYEKEEEC